MVASAVVVTSFAQNGPSMICGDVAVYLPAQRLGETDCFLGEILFDYWSLATCIALATWGMRRDATRDILHETAGTAPTHAHGHLTA